MNSQPDPQQFLPGFRLVLTLATAAWFFAGCASSNTSRTKTIRAARGTVKEVSFVAGPQRRGPGGPIGSIAGGLAGSTIGGGGAEHFVGAVGGSLVGGQIGMRLGADPPRDYIQQLTIRTEDEREYRLLPEETVRLRPGDRVFLMVESNGAPVSLIDLASGDTIRLR